MDFSLDEPQQAVADLAATVLHTDADGTRVSQAVASEAGYDETLWKAMAQAGLLGLAVPEALGGDGLGPVEMATVLAAVGRQIIPVPALATLALGVLPIVRLGSVDQQRAMLPDVAAGRVLSAAIREVSNAMPAEPATTARRDGDRFVVNGHKLGVPYAAQAHRLLVTTDAGVLLVDPRVDGVVLIRTPTSTGAPEYTLRLTDAVVPATDLLTPEVHTLHRFATAGAAAVADGVIAGALALTASHIGSRRQFGKALAAFQAVAQQIADLYVTARTVRLASLSANWRLAEELDADEDLDIAAYWLAQELPAALQACHHLHGGLGLDVTYPLHRYYSHAKDLARSVGGAAYRLDRIGSAVFVELSAEQRALQAELRRYFAGLVSPDQARAMLTQRHGPEYREIVRRMGRDGWLGVGWPIEYGGRGFGPVEQTIFVNEASRQDVPLPYVTLQTVGPTLQAYGTPEQKDLFLPRILAGEVHFAIGYTEPEAGTDLASLRTSAVRDGEHYVVNGQKVFTTGGHDADYVWLAARTDPDALRRGKPHEGISILIVDTSDPGFSWTPTITADGAHHTNTTYYADVRVPVGMRVGAENAGWKMITTQLNHERLMLGPAGRIAGLYERVRGWAARPGADGVAPLSQPDVHRALAETRATWRLNELLNWQVAARPDGEVNVADASATKVFASERVQRVFRLLEEVVGRHGDPADSKTAELARWLDVQAKRNLVMTFGGGVNEIQRELIATFGLGLPRVPR